MKKTTNKKALIFSRLKFSSLAWLTLYREIFETPGGMENQDKLDEFNELCNLMREVRGYATFKNGPGMSWDMIKHFESKEEFLKQFASILTPMYHQAYSHPEWEQGDFGRLDLIVEPEKRVSRMLVIARTVIRRIQKKHGVKPFMLIAPATSGGSVKSTDPETRMREVEKNILNQFDAIIKCIDIHKLPMFDVTPFIPLIQIWEDHTPDEFKSYETPVNKLFHKKLVESNELAGLVFSYDFSSSRGANDAHEHARKKQFPRYYLRDNNLEISGPKVGFS